MLHLQVVTVRSAASPMMRLPFLATVSVLLSKDLATSRILTTSPLLGSWWESNSVSTTTCITPESLEWRCSVSSSYIYVLQTTDGHPSSSAVSFKGSQICVESQSTLDWRYRSLCGCSLRWNHCLNTHAAACRRNPRTANSVGQAVLELPLMVSSEENSLIASPI